MDSRQIPAVVAYLKERAAYKWSTSRSIINDLGLAPLEPVALDGILVEYYQVQDTPQIRFSALPSSVSLEVLWGHIDRVGERTVTDIFRLDVPDGPQRAVKPEEVNMFLSYSFKDSAIALALSETLHTHGRYPWIAEVEILKRAHINEAVIKAIKQLPYFGVLLTDNTLNSGWSAKEIDFARREGRQVLGILYIPRLAPLQGQLKTMQERQESLRHKIFDHLFDKDPTVQFLPYPATASTSLLEPVISEERLISWEALNT